MQITEPISHQQSAGATGGLTIARCLVFALAAAGVTLAWSEFARTEVFWHHLGPNARAFSSIIAISEGTAPQPFVRRRLLPDAARMVSQLVPSPVWSAVDAVMTRFPRVPRHLGDWGWSSPDYYPLLLSATALIWLSVIGYMYAMRRIVSIEYETNDMTASVVGLLFGIALLGGGGDRNYTWYPYDFPMACLFAWTLVGFLSRAWWAVPIFALAAYCKETSLFLILAFVLLRKEPRRGAFYGELASLLVIYACIQAWLLYRFQDATVTESFFFPRRNAGLLVWNIVFSSWKLPLAIVAGVRLAQSWHRFPKDLRRLAWLIPCFVLAAFFKGWIEEWRQYTELLAIAGLILLQWVLVECHLGHLLVPARSSERHVPQPSSR